MNQLIYDWLTTAAVPPGVAWVVLRHRALLGRFSPPIPQCEAPPIWVHACSVGELNVARPLIAQLLARHPDIPVVLTVSTESAWRMALRQPLGAALTWFPVDQHAIVARFFDRLRPRALLLVETEIWPNVLREAERRNVPVIVVNARLSDKHFARYRRGGRLLRNAFSRITAVAAQHKSYAERFASLGVDTTRIAVTGNVKFDNLCTSVDPAKLESLRITYGLLPQNPVIVFGSTRPGDEVLAAACWERWKSQFPDARLIVVPRHLDRLKDALSAFDGRVLLRSRVPHDEALHEEYVLVVDTLGELVDFYALATVAIIGGSFYPGVNGHNPLEPAALGVPTVFGPFMSNFLEPAEALLNAGAAVQVEGPAALESAVTALLRDEARRAALSAAARDAIAKNQGALGRTLDFVDAVLLK